MTAVSLATLGDLSEKYGLYGVCNSWHAPAANSQAAE